MPFFSIIIPTYNSESTVKTAIESILSQTFTDFEIIIIDCLSQDNTIQILNSYCDHRLKIISEKDNGVYDAMNKGINASSGKWLYFLGSDDLFYKSDILEFINFKINIFDTVVYGDVKISGSVSWANNQAEYDGKFDMQKLKRKNICHQSIFYKRKLLVRNKIYYNTKYTICSDWEFNMRLWRIKKFKYVNAIVAIFNSGGISTQANIDIRFSNDYNDLVNKYLGNENNFFQSTFYYLRSF